MDHGRLPRAASAAGIGAPRSRERSDVGTLRARRPEHRHRQQRPDGQEMAARERRGARGADLSRRPFLPDLAGHLFPGRTEAAHRGSRWHRADLEPGDRGRAVQAVRHGLSRGGGPLARWSLDTHRPPGRRAAARRDPVGCGHRRTPTRAARPRAGRAQGRRGRGGLFRPTDKPPLPATTTASAISGKSLPAGISPGSISISPRSPPRPSRPTAAACSPRAPTKPSARGI